MPPLTLHELKDAFSGAAPGVSFEFFPPKTEAMEQKLWNAVTQLEPLQPAFVSVTYGAGGSTRERTHSTVTRILRETTLKPAAHLTCVAASKAEVDAVAQSYIDAGVKHIVALRGDMPGDAAYAPHAEGYTYSTELVAGLRRLGIEEISVAAFPEKHPQSTSFEQDIDVLKQKIDAGATRAITQFFVDIDLYRRFMERVRKAGITIPIVPGILPISNFGQTQKFAAMCGATVPQWMGVLFDGLDNDPATRALVSTHVAVQQCRLLQAEGAEHFHFYTLNRADLTAAVCHVLGVRPKKPLT